MFQKMIVILVVIREVFSFISWVIWKQEWKILSAWKSIEKMCRSYAAFESSQSVNEMT